MNENLNLCEILKDCPKGIKLWSPVWGRVTFETIDAFDDLVYIRTHKGACITLDSDGKFLDSDGKFDADGECIIFPSKDQRDWSKFVPLSKRFNPKEFKPFDKVLAKNRFSSKWTCTFFSYMDNNVSFPVYCSGGYFKVCIPYNEETKHLVGTKDDCPEYYKWWEK